MINKLDLLFLHQKKKEKKERNYRVGLIFPHLERGLRAFSAEKSKLECFILLFNRLFCCCREKYSLRSLASF